MRTSFSTLLALLLGLALAPPAASAQTGTLTGQVLDAGTGLVLPGATVTVDGSDRGAISDRTGRFLVPGLSAGTVTVRVRYLGYAEATGSVTIPADGSASLTFRLVSEAITLEGIEVTGTRDGQARALQQQRTAANITNVVAADQIGRFPDANIGDAMKRIPGFAVAMDQGEARFGLIRGTEPRLNSITLNGERVPSAEGDVRNVQLDLIPAEMVQSIEVNKAVTPDMDADAVGASVNIVTRQDPPGRRVSATVGSGYNALSGREMALGSFIYGDRVADGRLGFVLSGSVYNHHLGSDNIEAVWDEGDGGRAFVEEMDVRRYDVQRLRRSLSVAGDYRLSDVSSLNFRAMYNHRDDWENRYRLRFVLDEPGADGIAEGAIRRQTKGGGPDVRYTRLEDQRVITLLAGGDHLLGGRARVDWAAGYARASEDRPDERYIEWEASDLALRADVSNPDRPTFTPVSSASVTPEQFSFRRIEWLQSLTEEEDLTARLDVTLPLLGSESRNEFKFGARFRAKDKFRDNSFDRAIPLGGFLPNLAAGQPRDFSRTHLAGDYSYGTFSSERFLGDLPLTDAQQFRIQDRPDEYAAGNYEAAEKVYAGYLMWDRELTRRLGLVAGLRVEHTSVDYQGFEFDLDTDDVVRTPAQNDTYTNLLPGVHLRYETEGGSVIRAAWTNTISRPNYFDLVPTGSSPTRTWSWRRGIRTWTPPPR